MTQFKALAWASLAFLSYSPAYGRALIEVDAKEDSQQVVVPAPNAVCKKATELECCIEEASERFTQCLKPWSDERSACGRTYNQNMDFLLTSDPIFGECVALAFPFERHACMQRVCRAQRPNVPAACAALEEFRREWMDCLEPLRSTGRYAPLFAKCTATYESEVQACKERYPK